MYKLPEQNKLYKTACLKNALYVKGIFQYHVTRDVSVMLYIGTMANTRYLSQYADKLLKGENQSMHSLESPQYVMISVST